MVGYCNDYKDSSKYDIQYSAKTMDLRLNNDSLDNVYNIFEQIEEKLGIDLNNFTNKSNKGEKYLKTIVSDGTCFKKTRIIKLI